MVKILIEIDCSLNAVFVDLLPEIAVPIQETNCYKIQVEITRRFAVVPRQDAETSRVIRDRFVEPELGGEVGDRIPNRRGCPGLSVRVSASQIFLIILKNLFQLSQKIFVL